MLKLDRLSYFLAVADTGSFTQAAARLGVTKPVVSAQVARLEEELGVSLFVRTTRSVTLTEDGEVLAEHARRILAAADSARQALQTTSAEPSGILRIAAPLDYGQTFLVPVLAQFRALYPACKVTLDLSDSLIDLREGNWDLSLRLGWLFDSSLKARRVGQITQHLVADSTLVAQLGAPVHPEDLARWPFVMNTALHEPLRHEFESAQGRRVQIVPEMAAGMSSTPAVLAAVLAGLGAAILPDFLVTEPLESGRLTKLLPDWRLPEGGIYIVYPPTRFRPPRVVEFTRLLIAAEARRRKG